MRKKVYLLFRFSRLAEEENNYYEEIMVGKVMYMLVAGRVMVLLKASCWQLVVVVATWGGRCGCGFSEEWGDGRNHLTNLMEIRA